MDIEPKDWIRERLTRNQSFSFNQYSELFSIDSSEVIAVYESQMGSTDYEFVRLLGKGGQGDVLLVLNTATQEERALKRVRRLGNDIEPLQRETDALIKLSHPNIASLVATPIFRDEYFFIPMRFVAGTDLQTKLESVQVNKYSEIVRYLSKVADAIEYANDQSIVHRDLKPANIMVGDDGEVIVVDFGIAKFVRSEPENATFAGTPAFLAPEVLNAQNIDFRTDTYGLGATLYKLLTDRHVRTHNEAIENVTPALPAVGVNEDEVYKSLYSVCEKALSDDPDDRYQSAADFKRAIVSALAEHTEEPTSAAKIRRQALYFALFFPLCFASSFLGSLLWFHIPYWPTFILLVLIATFFNWQLAIIVGLTAPVIAEYLLRAEPISVYALCGMVQLVLALLLFKWLNVSAGLSKPIEKWLIYPLVVIALPSSLSATLSWHLQLTLPSESLLAFVAFWTLENTLPAFLPGIALHTWFNQLSTNRLKKEKISDTSWATRRLAKYSMPWVITLLVAGSMVGVLFALLVPAFQQGDSANEIHKMLALNHPLLAERAYWFLEWANRPLLTEILPVQVSVMHISLVAVLGGFMWSLLVASQAAVSAQSLDKYLPLSLSERYPQGELMPRLSVLTIKLHDQESLAEDMLSETYQPWWESIYALIDANDGAIDYISVDELMILFGLRSENSARSAINCVYGLANNPTDPPARVSYGIATGSAWVGEIGPESRVRQTIVSDIVSRSNKCSKIAADNSPFVCIDHKTRVAITYAADDGHQDAFHATESGDQFWRINNIGSLVQSS